MTTSLTSARSIQPSARPVPWWRIALTSEPYRRTVFLVVAIPTAVLSVFDGGRAQQRLAAVLMDRTVGRHRFRALLAVPVDALALVIIGYCWSIVLLNIAYPARPLIGMDGDYSHAWGGPTLAGAWALHGILGGLGFLMLTPWLVRGFTALWVRLLQR